MENEEPQEELGFVVSISQVQKSIKPVSLHSVPPFLIILLDRNSMILTDYLVRQIEHDSKIKARDFMQDLLKTLLKKYNAKLKTLTDSAPWGTAERYQCGVCCSLQLVSPTVTACSFTAVEGVLDTDPLPRRHDWQQLTLCCQLETDKKVVNVWDTWEVLCPRTDSSVLTCEMKGGIWTNWKERTWAWRDTSEIAFYFQSKLPIW